MAEGFRQWFKNRHNTSDECWYGWPGEQFTDCFVRLANGMADYVDEQVAAMRAGKPARTPSERKVGQSDSFQSDS